MSTRDDQPVTVPPPEGEDDAYSATTKVGAMPAQIMEKLRAEGLLPDDVEEEEKAKARARDARIASRRPAITLEDRSSGTPPPSSGKPVPQLYSLPPTPEPEGEEDDSAVPASKLETAKPPPPPEPVAPLGDAADAPIETPVAFAFPPAAQVPRIEEPAPPSAPSLVSEERPEMTTATTTQQKPAKAPSKVVMALVAVLVVVFLVVALIRLRG